MRSPTFLIDPLVPLVADTSTVINLIATGCARPILEALPNPIVVVEVILGELNTGRSRGRVHADRFQEIIDEGYVAIVSLGDAGWMHFEMLVAGAAQETVDDGEAATIAYAAEHGAVAILDEKKGTRICASRFPDLNSISTVDVLLHPKVRESLGDGAFVDAVFAALRDARMAVLPHHLDEVLQLIGPERAGQCPSLPARARLSDREALLIQMEHGA
jgi:predicted nucleic acid-binding protein